jgi:hypothetical protein
MVYIVGSCKATCRYRGHMLRLSFLPSPTRYITVDEYRRGVAEMVLTTMVWVGLLGGLITVERGLAWVLQTLLVQSGQFIQM